MPPPFFMVTDERFFMITIHSWEIDAEDFLKYITFGSSTSLNCFIVKCFFSFSNLMEFFWLFHVRCFLHHNPMLIASAGTLQRTLKPYLIIKLLQNVFWKVWLYRKPFLLIRVFYLELEYLVIALVPSLTACLASSPGSLNFARWDCWSFVTSCKFWSFTGNSFEDIVDKWVHDIHCLARYSNIRMDLFQNFEDIDSITFFSRSSSFRSLCSSFFATFPRSFFRTCRSWWSFLWTSSHCFTVPAAWIIKFWD